MIKYWNGVSAAGMMVLLLFQPAYALESQENSEEGVEGTSLLSTKPNQLSEIKQPYTTVAEWLEVQAERTITITNIQLNPTATGVEVVLETQGQVTSTTSTVGNALIVEIPNAVLTGDRFEQAEPAEGIALITAESLPGNRVRVAITGTEAPPTATVQAETQSLIVGITPGTATADVTDDNGINIVVTAEKTPQDPLNVPISLTVIRKDELEDAQINSIRDIAANTPNFFASVGDRAFNFYSIRGISNSNFLVRDSVGFYLDDVPIEYFHQLFPGDLFDLEQVEVLRGPQNTLYGRNSIAGVVNVTSRPPSEVLETQLGLEYGTYNQRRVQASISDTLIPDTLGFRLSGVYSARDGFTENTLLNQDANNQSDFAGRLNLLWTPSPDWSISFNALGAASQDAGAVYVAIDQNDPFKIEENRIADLDLSVAAQSLRVRYDGDNFRFTSVTTHNSSSTGYLSDGDYTAQDLYSFNTEIRSNIWSQEFRLQSTTDTQPFNWLVGAYVQNRQFDVDQQQVEYTREGAAFFGIPDVRFGDTVAKYDQDTLAAFGQVNFVPIDPLTLTVGLRYEYSRDELERSDRTGTFDGVVTTSGEIKDSIDGDALIPRFAVTYRFNPNVAAYGSITRGYRPVTLNYNTADASLNNVQQESSWNYEIGLKSSLLDNRLTFSLAGFINEIDDYQVLLPNAQGFLVGFEAEARAIPLEGLELIAGFGFADAKYTNYSNSSTGESFNGNKLTYAPEYTFNLAAQYRSSGGFFSRVELQGLGTYYFDDANTLKQDPFVLVNTRIGYEFDNSGVYLFANNLFDQEYFTAAFAPFGTPRANYGDRRVFGIQFQTRF